MVARHFSCFPAFQFPFASPEKQPSIKSTKVDQCRRLNYLLLGALTIALGILVGLACAFSSGRVSLQSAIGTFVAVVCLTPYTL
ncbi:hypothetical protein OIU78_012611 [Salix suchowensis]|nr:hypothetical protein OIU78_012611 [Salix suchowensis]